MRRVLDNNGRTVGRHCYYYSTGRRYNSNEVHLSAEPESKQRKTTTDGAGLTSFVDNGADGVLLQAIQVYFGTYFIGTNSSLLRQCFWMGPSAAAAPSDIVCLCRLPFVSVYCFFSALGWRRRFTKTTSFYASTAAEAPVNSQVFSRCSLSIGRAASNLTTETTTIGGMMLVL